MSLFFCLIFTIVDVIIPLTKGEIMKKGSIYLVLLLSVLFLFVSCADKPKEPEHLTVDDLFVWNEDSKAYEFKHIDIPSQFEWKIKLNWDNISKRDIVVGENYLTLSDDGPEASVGRRLYAKDLAMFVYNFEENCYTEMRLCEDKEQVFRDMAKYSALGKFLFESNMNKENYSYSRSTTYLDRTVDVFNVVTDDPSTDRYEYYFDRETRICLKQVGFSGEDVVENEGYETMVLKFSGVEIEDQEPSIAAKFWPSEAQFETLELPKALASITVGEIPDSVNAFFTDEHVFDGYSSTYFLERDGSSSFRSICSQVVADGVNTTLEGNVSDNVDDFIEDNSFYAKKGKGIVRISYDSEYKSFNFDFTIDNL